MHLNNWNQPTNQTDRQRRQPTNRHYIVKSSTTILIYTQKHIELYSNFRNGYYNNKIN